MTKKRKEKQIKPTIFTVYQTHLEYLPGDELPRFTETKSIEI